MPGYLPEMTPYECNTHEEAKEALIAEMEEALIAEMEMSADSAGDDTIDAWSNSINEVEALKPDTGIRVYCSDGYCYWITIQ